MKQYVIDAVEGNNPSLLLSHIRRKEDANAIKDGVISVLSLAVLRGYAEIVRILLAAGADPNPDDGLRASPLEIAVIRGDHEIVTDLLAAGANPEGSSKFGEMAIKIARLSGNSRVFVALEVKVHKH